MIILKRDGGYYKCDSCKLILHFDESAEVYLTDELKDKFLACLHFYLLHYKKQNDKTHLVIDIVENELSETHNIVTV